LKQVKPVRSEEYREYQGYINIAFTTKQVAAFYSEVGTHPRLTEDEKRDLKELIRVRLAQVYKPIWVKIAKAATPPHYEGFKPSSGELLISTPDKVKFDNFIFENGYTVIE